MKITAVSAAALCLAASAMAASIPDINANEADMMNNNLNNMLDKRAPPAAVINKKDAAEHGAKDAEKKAQAPAAADKKDGAKKKAAVEAKDEKKAEAPAPAVGAAVPADPHALVPQEYESPLWLVQPYAESIWSQGTTYVITWGPNPDPDYAKNISPKSPVDIRLMQGPPDKLKPVATLAKAADSSTNSFEWLVPATVAPGKDYTVRITQPGKLDTYSHYFEVAPKGDARATKSNVGLPLELPKKGDAPQPLNKGPIIQPAAPPNPFPAEKPATPAAGSNPATINKPAAAKPAVNTASNQNANFLAFAMTLFGAVYFL
ncbi:hypothetical protein EC991_008092 [Linnemannia zychae]|nr:hypothetical protein EC991_008092 [Linnemannia zychae]